MVSLINKQIKHTGALGVGTVVEQDDIIFHCSDGCIQVISRVKAACEDSARPGILQVTG